MVESVKTSQNKQTKTVAEKNNLIQFLLVFSHLGLLKLVSPWKTFKTTTWHPTLTINNSFVPPDVFFEVIPSAILFPNSAKYHPKFYM